MGAPSSPLLSNIACTQLDRRFADIGQSFDGAMSRYCDDMTFSSDEPLPNHIMVFDGTVPGKIDPGPGLAGSLEESGFEVNSRKTRLRTFAQCQQVRELRYPVIGLEIKATRTKTESGKWQAA